MKLKMPDLFKIKSLIHDYEIKYRRSSSSVKLLAVTKGRSLEEINRLILAGQNCFGESYLQEALHKINTLQDKKLEWHFIGPIQRNKTRKITENFSWVHSVSSQLIAERLAVQHPPQFTPLNICIEVNISNEINKSGVLEKELEPLASFCMQQTSLKLRGLMCIPAFTKNFLQQRSAFRQLKFLFDTLNAKGFNLDTLSMGMSHDFEAAIAEGATIVRLGTILFEA